LQIENITLCFHINYKTHHWSSKKIVHTKKNYALSAV